MNSFYNGYFTPDYFIKKEKEKRELKKVGALCGIGLCSYVLIQNVLALGIQAVGLWDMYMSNTFFQCGADIFLTFAGVLLPFGLINRFMKKYTGVKEPLAFDREVSRGSLFTAVMAGTGLCMAANIISSVFVTVMSVFGFTLTSPDVPMPEGSAGFLLSFVRVVVAAAMAEELAIRGYVLGNLRKYGELFAISVSAIIFAVMHGNLIQSPFALMAGFTIGYFTVKTGTLWTGIIIHGINNFISLSLSYIIELEGQDTGTLIYAAIIYALGLIGLVCAVIFSRKNRNKKLSDGASFLSTGEKLSGFFFNLPMLIAFAVMLYVTSNYVEFGW